MFTTEEPQTKKLEELDSLKQQSLSRWEKAVYDLRIAAETSRDRDQMKLWEAAVYPETRRRLPEPKQELSVPPAPRSAEYITPAELKQWGRSLVKFLGKSTRENVIVPLKKELAEAKAEIAALKAQSVVSVNLNGRTFEMVSADGSRSSSYVAIPIYQGPFRAKTDYAPGDMVSFGGSIWHCNTLTQLAPGTPESANAWTLCVKHGRDLR